MAIKQGIVFYDFMTVRGGAERVTETLLSAWPGTDLCTAYVNPEAFPSLTRWGNQLFDLRAESRQPLWRVLRIILAFHRLRLPLAHYDWALFSGSYAPVAATRRAGPNLLYCHTIPRFCFDLREHYRRKLPWFARPLFAALVAQVTRDYRRALAHMDVVIANSENVRQRLLRHFGQEALVIHPPVQTDHFRWLEDGDTYVSLARLEDFKRVDVIVRAFLRLPERRLVVASGGAELPALRRLAAGAPNITFTNWLSEAELRELVGRARAAVYVPMDEDFGMSPVEAMAAGKPVIGVAAGGLLETIVPGRTGLLIPEPLTPEALCQAVRELEAMDPPGLRAACEVRAAEFAEAVFLRKMNAVMAPVAG